MAMPSYSIGTISRIIGMSRESIRYYEKKGIVAPVKNPHSGYRTYDNEDVALLVRLRMYIRCGFSVDKIAGLLHRNPNSATLLEIADRINDIDQEISKLEDLRRDLHRWLEFMTSTLSKHDECQIGLQPAIYFTPCFIDGNVINDEEQLKYAQNWINLQPTTFNCWRINVDMTGAVISSYQGMGISEPNARMLGIDRDKNASHIAARPCIRWSGALSSGDDPNDVIMRSATEFMRDSELQIDGDLIAISAIICQERGQIIYWNNYYLPVKPAR
jgi:DNA-binding transcriptional MerR regulator